MSNITIKNQSPNKQCPSSVLNVVKYWQTIIGGNIICLNVTMLEESIVIFASGGILIRNYLTNTELFTWRSRYPVINAIECSKMTSLFEDIKTTSIHPVKISNTSVINVAKGFLRKLFTKDT